MDAWKKRAIGISLLIIILGIFFIGNQIRTPRIHEKQLQEKGYPGGIYRKQNQLKHLHIEGPEDDFSWIGCNLESLTIQSRKLQSLATLPTCLRKLHLINTNLRDLQGIDRLTDLEELTLENNTSLVDLSTLEKMSNLRTLEIRLDPRWVHTRMTKFPKALPGLIHLHLENALLPRSSQLESSPPDPFPTEGFTSLKSLFFDGAGGRNPVPEFSRLTNLNQLEIVDFPLVTMPSLPGIHTLHLKNHRRLQSLDHLPESLTTLILTDNRLISIDRIPSLPNLTSLTLIKTPGTVDDLSHLGSRVPNLETLKLEDLYSQRLSGLAQLSQLRTLHLIRLDRLQSLDFLAGLDLEELVIESGGDLVAEKFTAIDKLNNLKVLRLESTRIETLDIDIWPKLHFLDLVRNEELEPIANLISQDTLETLTLDQNAQQIINSLEDLPPLKRLIWRGFHDLGINLALSNEVLLEFGEPGGDHIPLSLSSLRTVDLSNNDIPNLTRLADATNLQNLTLYATKIESLAALQNAASLKSLDLRYSKVRSLKELPKNVEILFISIRKDNPDP